MADFTTDAYLVPKINTVYSAQLLKLESDADSTFEERVRDCPAIPIGTTSLQNWQAERMANDDGTTSTGPLYLLNSPIEIEWKVQGQPDNYYTPANGPLGKLPNISPSAPLTPYTLQWEWREGIVFLTPLNYPVDLRVRGLFPMTPLVQDKDNLGVHPRMYVATALATAAVIGKERNNPTWITYGDDAEALTDYIENILVKAEQGTTTRIGRYGGRSGWGGSGIRQ